MLSTMKRMAGKDPSPYEFPGGSSFRTAKLTDSLFECFSSLIYDKTGIYLKSEKKELLNARLGKRLRACGLDSFEEYYQFVMDDKKGTELVHLIDSVSTNFTSFFRENAHFDFLKSSVLPSFVHEGRGRSEEISVWSSACSSGEEPYTLVMILDSFLGAHPGTRFKVLATDISTRVLETAQRGVYPEEKVGGVPREFLKKYFQKGVGKSAGYVKVKNNMGQHVEFSHFNLMGEFPWTERFDIIFCRNVMIYFNRETQKALVEKFYNCLRPGGYFFIGHSESITNFKQKFEQVAATAYRK